MTEAATLLVVNDSTSKRYLLCSWLRRAGHSVIEAGTGGEALAMMASDPVDLVVLDVSLPDMTGFEVCEQIKAEPKYAAIPVIHVSATAVEVADRTQSLARGADVYLVEPIDPAELVATNEAVLRYYWARQQAERLADRLSKLAQLAVELHAATSLRQLLSAAATGTAKIYDAPALVCGETTEGVRMSAVVCDPAGPPAIRGWNGRGFPVPVGSTYQDAPATDWPQLELPADTTVLALGARNRADHPPTYVVVPEAVTDEGAPVLIQIGQIVVSAIESLRAYVQEHRLALTLQRSLLPSELPPVAGYDVAVRYVPASDQAEIGGDFYELTQLPGRLAVAVGDVAGHSLHAATVMAELRHATRAYLAEGHAPGAVLGRLNRLMVNMIPDETATLCLVDIEAETGTARLANAGHPPPLLISTGQSSYLTEHSPLLGVPGPPPTETTFAIDPGTVLVLFTDGLVERRGYNVDDGLAWLAEAARVVDYDLDQFCDRLLTEVGSAEPDDDIAIVALRRHG